MARVHGRRAYEAALLAIFLIGIVAALTVAIPRHRLEKAHRTVDIIADWQSWQEVAAVAGVSREHALAVLQDAGVTRLAVGETRLSQLIDRGLVAMVTYNEAVALPFIDNASDVWHLVEDAASRNKHAVFLIWKSNALPPYQHEQLLARLQTAGARPITSGETHAYALLPPPGKTIADVKKTWRDIGLGYDADTLAFVMSYHFPVALRPLAGPYFDAAAVERRVLASSEPVVYVFDGAAVPGQPATISVWDKAIGAQGNYVAMVEFATQFGVRELIMSHRYKALRLHSIVADELHQLPVQRSVARWWRAVSERGIRALYVRPYTDMPGGVGTDRLWAFNVDYVTEIAARLQGTGWHLGAVEPFVLPGLTFLSYICIVIGTAVGVVWLSRFFIAAPPWLELGVVGAAIVFALWQRGTMGRELIAFVAAATLPALGTLWAFRHASRTETKGNASGRCVVSLLLASTVSLIGALFVVGLLSSTPYALGVSLFRGVKAMHVVPPLIVVFGLLWDKPLAKWSDAKAQWQTWRSINVKLIDVAFIAMIGLIGLVVVMRTGNETLPVLSWELQFREWLEHTLSVRPRNKEFLLGHPAFIVGMFLVPRRKRHSVWPAVAGGLAAVGQASLVNTFAHLHSPLRLGMVRSGYGLLIGACIGLVVTMAMVPLFSRPARVVGGDAV